MFFVVVGTLGTGKEGLLVDTWVARLIESSDAELLICVFLDDTKGVFVSVE